MRELFLHLFCLKPNKKGVKQSHMLMAYYPIGVLRNRLSTLKIIFIII